MSLGCFRRIAAFVLVALSLAGSAMGSPAQDLFRKFGFQIKAQDCVGAAAGGARFGTGFAWKDKEAIVTAFHVVAGCRQISALRPGDGLSNLVVAGLDLDRDIAILRPIFGPLPNASQGAEVAAPPSPGAPLIVVGHPLGVTSPLESHLLSRGLISLRAAIPPDVRGPLIIRNSPNLDATILGIEGHLTFGHSGAPIMDAAGRVVAVANGGLERGTNEIAWAVPLENVQFTLPKSVDAARLSAVEANQLFRSVSMSAQSDATCFDRQFVLVREIALGDVGDAVDDPLTFSQLSFLYGLDGPVRALRVLAEPRDGIRLVVPADWQLKENGPTTCTARAHDAPGIELVYRLNPVKDGDVVAAGLQSMKFENETFCDRGYVLDLALSNLAPRLVPARGRVTQRRSFNLLEMRCGPGPMMAPVLPEAFARLQPAVVYRNGPLQCQAVCLPPAFPSPRLTAQGRPAAEGVGFASHVMTHAWAMTNTVEFRKKELTTEIAECAASLSGSDRCREVYSLSDAWANAVLAAMASTIEGY